MSTRVSRPHSSAEQLVELERLLKLCEGVFKTGGFRAT
jgi:hypothetical protein